MTWQQIWQIILQFLNHLKDASHWKASKDGKSIGPVAAVSFSPTDAKLVVKDEGKDLTLEAKPGAPDHADVYVNGEKQPNGRLVVALKSQPPFKPIIVVLVFKHVQVGGSIHDYRFDNPK